MLKKLRSWMSKAIAPPATRSAEQSASTWNVRRFEAAETNRLNRAHWQKAREQSMNVDLVMDLSILRARMSYEIARNPILEGVVKTLSDDVVGEDGPMLRVQSDSPEYNKAFQDLWWEWFNSPDLAGVLTGVEILKMWVRRLCDCGEYVAQKVTKQVNPGPVALRLKVLHPRRLATPTALDGDANIVLGVKRSEAGEPLEYYITEPAQFGAYSVASGNYKTVNANDLIHVFVTTEEDQARGFPWLSTALPTTADLRDFDAQVLDACRAAADQAIVWFTDHPDVQPIEVNETTDIERRMQQTGPPGWKPMQMTPEQPSVNHLDYRADRMREIGRPIGMPLMMIRLGSEDHNFASARFDNNIYKRCVRGFRRWMERKTINSLVDEVRREGQLYAAANPGWKYAILARPPAKVDFSFIWQPLTATDAEKDAQDEESRMTNGTLAFEDACANAGTDMETQIGKVKRAIDAFKAAGIPLPDWAQTWGDPLLKQAAAIAGLQNAAKPGASSNGNGVARHN